MKLEDLARELKLASEKIESFLHCTETESCMKYAEEYIKANGLESMAPDIRAAIHAGFFFRAQQERIGKYKELEK